MNRRLGQYRLLAGLGHGGMADIFLAVCDGPSSCDAPELAVIKRLRAHLTEDAEFATMITEEARITAQLRHPNVVRLIEAGTDGDTTYLAMEFLDGQALSRIMRRAAAGAVEVALELKLLVVRDVLAGLHYAHGLVDDDGTPLSIVHRDVNPQNVFVTYDGHVKLVDFGIAKAAGRACETSVGSIKGKLRYMSPEQISGRDVDRRTDVFAAGIMLWQLLTGKRFWGDCTEIEILHALVTKSFDVSPRAVRSDLSEALDAICRKALAPKCADRYATADDMKADMDAILGPRVDGLRFRLASLVDSLFAEERAEIDAIVANYRESDEYVDREQSALSEFNTALSESIQASLAQSRAFVSPPSVPPVAPSSFAPMSLDVAPPELADVLEPVPGAKRGRRGLRLVAGVAAAALLCMLGVALHDTSFRESSASAAQRAPRVVMPDVQELEMGSDPHH